MNGKRIISLLLTAALLFAGAAVYASGATANDPLVTLSYLQEIFIKPVDQRLTEGGNKLLQSSLSKLDAQSYSSTLGTKLDAAYAAALENTRDLPCQRKTGCIEKPSFAGQYARANAF